MLDISSIVLSIVYPLYYPYSIIHCIIHIALSIVLSIVYIQHCHVAHGKYIYLPYTCHELHDIVMEVF